MATIPSKSLEQTDALTFDVLSVDDRVGPAALDQFMQATFPSTRKRRQGAVLIQDNATYHKDGDVWAWFDANRHWLEVHQLPPPYSPDLNPTERLWRYTRQTGTHNRYFPDETELTGTLRRVFGEMQTYPELIRPYLKSFL